MRSHGYSRSSSSACSRASGGRGGPCHTLAQEQAVFADQEVQRRADQEG
jgi:hypothetical protein